MGMKEVYEIKIVNRILIYVPLVLVFKMIFYRKQVANLFKI